MDDNFSDYCPNRHPTDWDINKELQSLPRKFEAIDVQGKSAIARLRWFCKFNLFYLCYHILGYRDMDPLLHTDVCNWVDKRIDKPFLVLLPREHFKSSIITVGLSIQDLLRDNGQHNLITSATPSLVSQFSLEIRTHFDASQPLKVLFPEVCYENPSKQSKRWNDKEMIIRRDRKIVREPSLTFLSAGSMAVGYHFTRRIYDDIVNYENTATNEQLNKLHQWLAYTQSLGSGAVERYIGTRYHFNDIYEDLIKQAAKGYLDVYTRKAIEKGRVIFPGKFSIEKLDQLKTKQGSYIFSCNPGYSPILMADWTFKNIEEIREGEMVVGFENNGTISNKRKMVPSKVLEIGNRIEDVYEIELESGRKIYCTKDHKWFTGRDDESHRLYAEARVGGSLLCVTDAYWEERDDPWEEGYLAGILDGEGSIKGSYISISQSRKHNPGVCYRIEYCLKKLNLEYVVEKYKHKSSNIYRINGGRDIKIWMINKLNYGKKGQTQESLWKHPGRMIKRKDKVKSIVRSTRQIVYSMQTETGNYVAWGYASKNCQYMNSPIDEENAIFLQKDINWLEDWKDRDGNNKLPEMNTFVIFDPNFTEKEDKSMSNNAIAVIGIDAYKNKFLLDYNAQRGKIDETLDVAIKFMIEYKVSQNVIHVEDCPVYKYIKKAFFEKFDRMKLNYGVCPVKIRNRDKFSRIMRIQPELQSGKWWIPKGASDVIDELVKFPKFKRRDIVDTMSYIYDIGYEPEAYTALSGRQRMQKRSRMGWWDNRFSGKNSYMVA